MGETVPETPAPFADGPAPGRHRREIERHSIDWVPLSERHGRTSSLGEGDPVALQAGHVFVDGVPADAEESCDRGDGVLWAGGQVSGVADLFIGHGRRAAEAGATGAGCVQALVGALVAEFSDELSEGGEDVSAARGGGVECLVERGEANAALA